jgi:methanogenic corrinoid protein MtbC1
MSSEISERLKNAVVNMDSEIASETAHEIITKNLDVAEAVINGLNAGMREVARGYDRREIYLPQVLASANAFYTAFDILRPYLSVDEYRPSKILLIGVVEGDIHDIGKNLIKVMIEAHGFHSIDLGRDVPNEDFLEKIEKTKPDYIAISTLMTPTLRGMRDLVHLIKEMGLLDGRKIMVGGGQVSQEFADEIGADFYGVDDRDTIAWMNDRENKDVRR